LGEETKPSGPERGKPWACTYVLFPRGKKKKLGEFRVAIPKHDIQKGRKLHGVTTRKDGGSRQLHVGGQW